MRWSRQVYPRTAVWWAVASFVAGGGLLVGGCGQLTRPSNGRRVQVFLMEYRLRPDRIVARRGELVLVVHNLGRLTHNLSVSHAGKGVASTQPIPPGGSARLNLSLAAGTYRISSTMGADQALGARGMLRMTRR